MALTKVLRGGLSTGVSDSSDATAITIDSSETVGIKNTGPGNYLDGELTVGDSTKDQYINVVTGTGNAAGLCFQDTTGTSIISGLRYTHLDNALGIWTNGSQRATIDSTGNMLFNQSGTGVYLGVTSATASNLLDDYEEGTWTPAYSGGGSAPTVGYSQQVGSYVKVGKLVFLSFSLNTSSVSGGSSSSDLSVSGIPFACGSGTGDRGALSTVRTQNWVSNARSPVAGYINEGSSLILLSSYDAGAYSTATLCDTDDLRTTGDSNQLTATVTYISA